MNEGDTIEMTTTWSVMAKGVVGTCTPMLGLIVSNTYELETWLRISSLSVGILVGLASLWSILKGKKRP